jgi:hypothetical protein
MFHSAHFHAIRSLMALLAMACMISHAQARTVFWGGPTGAVLYQSDGVTPVDSSFTFQLGSFEVGFDPTTQSVENWASNWRVFDQAAYNDSTQFFQSTALMNEFGQSNGVNANTSFDFRSQRLYLWVYDSNVFNPQTPTNEMALFTGDSWVLPSTGNPCCGGDSLPLQLYVENMTAAITGNVDPDFDGNGVPIVGSIGSSTQPGTVYDFQTHSITAIPEPSLGVLSMLGFVAMILRRKR